MARPTPERGLRTSAPWVVGWSAGGLVVTIAAGLLLTIIGLGRRIARQARDIEAALDGARENTSPLFAVAETNATLERTTGYLRALREEAEGR